MEFLWTDQADDKLIELVKTKGKHWALFSKYFDGLHFDKIRKRFEYLVKSKKVDEKSITCKPDIETNRGSEQFMIDLASDQKEFLTYINPDQFMSGSSNSNSSRFFMIRDGSEAGNSVYKQTLNIHI